MIKKEGIEYIDNFENQNGSLSSEDRLDSNIGKAAEGAEAVKEVFSSDESLLIFKPLLDEIISLKEMLKKRLLYDETKEKAFERLYQELDLYKKNETFNAMRPLYLDLVLLFDRIENVKKDATKKKKFGHVQLGEFMQSLRDEIIEILYRNGIEIINNTSLKFDPHIQQAVATEATDVETDNNSIAQVVRKGFKYQNQIIRPEEVIIRKYNATRK